MCEQDTGILLRRGYREDQATDKYPIAYAVPQETMVEQGVSQSDTEPEPTHQTRGPPVRHIIINQQPRQNQVVSRCVGQQNAFKCRRLWKVVRLNEQSEQASSDSPGDEQDEQKLGSDPA